MSAGQYREPNLFMLKSFTDEKFLCAFVNRRRTPHELKYYLYDVNDETYTHFGLGLRAKYALQTKGMHFGDSLYTGKCLESGHKYKHQILTSKLGSQNLVTQKMTVDDDKSKVDKRRYFGNGAVLKGIHNESTGTW